FGCDPVRTADGPASVPGGVGGGNRAASDLSGTCPAFSVECEGASRPGDDLPEVPAQGARASLRERRSTGRRPEALPGGTADRGGALELGSRVVALAPAQSCGGSAGGGSADHCRADTRQCSVAGAAASRAARGDGTAGGTRVAGGRRGAGAGGGLPETGPLARCTGSA